VTYSAVSQSLITLNPRKIAMAVAAQELIGDFEEEDFLDGIKRLKRNKAVRVDGMQADIIISGKVFLAEPLNALFNKVIHSRLTPKHGRWDSLRQPLRKATLWSAVITGEQHLEWLWPDSTPL
jgi:hypothetical protein